MDYGPMWARDYWESLCHCWATGPWQERSPAAKHNQAAHLEKNVHTNGVKSSSVPLYFASYLIGLISGRGRMTMSARVLARLPRPMTGRWRIAIRRALPSQNWIRRHGLT
ncbi:hypothetical protein Taro_052545 [Colocasia esculenta]|uniref:Uncharacterized protein n=1 Tax=Colocasia esculenta TaxID=4460 RepID=A0A843XIY4_COLES|nr:hypothetical protein [Colocasia esculenta]